MGAAVRSLEWNGALDAASAEDRAPWVGHLEGWIERAISGGPVPAV